MGAVGVQCRCLFAQVVGLAPLETALARGFELLGDDRCVFPVARTFVVGQQCQVRLGFEARALKLEQGVFGAVQ